ncbi:MAG: hypothetical protein E7559_00785 [Ruminococcaceae bacterium]|nr:hypothetical protein [Oscillospiraceae bacterium]
MICCFACQSRVLNYLFCEICSARSKNEKGTIEMKKHFIVKKAAAIMLVVLMIVSVLITAVPPEGFDWAMEAEAAEEVYSPVLIEEFNGHTYAVFHELSLWEDAKEICEQMGGHLATITSEEEQTYFEEILPTEHGWYWLGASDTENEGEWKWVTEEEFEYENWGSGCPDNTYGTENFLVILSEKAWFNSTSHPRGVWNDRRSFTDEPLPFICEWDYIDGEVQEETYPYGETLYFFDDIRYNFENYPGYFYYSDFEYVFGDTEWTRQLWDSKKNGFNPLIWNHYFKSNGVCYGISATSLLMNNYSTSEIKPSQFSWALISDNSVYDIGKTHYNHTYNFTAQDFIEYMHISQYKGARFNSRYTTRYYNSSSINNDRADTLQSIIDRLLSKQSIEIAVHNSIGGHSIFPYRVEVINNHEAKVYVYDSNSPDDFNKFISIWKSELNDGEYNNTYDCWYYQSFKGFECGSDYTDSSIAFAPYTAINSDWTNICSANNPQVKSVLNDSVRLFASSDGAINIYSESGNFAKIYDGKVQETDIEELIEILDTTVLEGYESSKSDTAMIYLPVGMYTVTNEDKKPVELTFSDTHSSIDVIAPVDSEISIYVSDAGYNSIDIVLAESSDNSDLYIEFGYDDTADEFINTAVISGDITDTTVSAKMTDNGILVDGYDNIVVYAQKDCLDCETDSVDIADSSVLITITGDEEEKTLNLIDQTDSAISSAEMQVCATDIVIDYSSLNMNVGQSTKLTASILPVQHIDEVTTKWMSTDESIATVSEDGTVTAVSEGYVKIACLTNNAFIQDYCKVYVTANGNDSTPTNSVELQDESIEINAGDAYALSADVALDMNTEKAVWISSDENIATVENGLVTGVSVGTATIIITVGEVSDTCEVTVIPTNVKSVTLSSAKANLSPNESVTLTATISPVGADDSITWSTSDSRIATVDSNGNVAAHALGTAIITATVGEVSASCTVEVVPPISLTAMGGSVRIVEPYGLRFGIQLKKDEAYNEYKDSIASYGTLIIPKKNLGDVPLTFDVEKAMDVPAVNIYSEDDTQRTYTGVLVGIPKSAFYSDIVGRGYLKYLDIDGNEKVMYTDEIVRSYYQVANSAYTRYGAMTDRDATEQAVYEKLAALLSEMTDGDNITNY